MLPSVCLQSVIISAVSFSCFSPIENIYKTSFLYSNWDLIIIKKKTPPKTFLSLNSKCAGRCVQIPHWFVPFMSCFPALIKQFLPINALQKWKKNVCEGHKKWHCRPAVLQQKQLWFVLRLQTWSDSKGNIWMLSQVRFRKKKKEEKVKVKVLFEKVRKWHGCVWAMSWINLWQALGIKLVRSMFYPAPDYVF